MMEGNHGLDNGTCRQHWCAWRNCDLCIFGIFAWPACVGHPYRLPSFYGCGGKQAGFVASVVANIFGAICAWIALIVFTKFLAAALGVPVGAAVAVGLTIVLLVMGAKIPALSAIPATVYGYASTAALFLLKGTPEGLTAADISNPLIAIVISMIIGNNFGFVSEKLAGAMVSA